MCRFNGNQYLVHTNTCQNTLRFAGCDCLMEWTILYIYNETTLHLLWCGWFQSKQKLFDVSIMLYFSSMHNSFHDRTITTACTHIKLQFLSIFLLLLLVLLKICGNHCFVLIFIFFGSIGAISLNWIDRSTHWQLLVFDSVIIILFVKRKIKAKKNGKIKCETRRKHFNCNFCCQ